MIASYFEYTDKKPHWYDRTATQYCRTPFSDMAKLRGINSPLLNNLIEILPPGAFLAGGFVASVLKGEKHQASDIDIFFDGPKSFANAYQLISNPPEGDKAWSIKSYKPPAALNDLHKLQSAGNKLRYVKFESDNKERLPIQLIKMYWYQDVEHVIDSFDLTVTQFAIGGGDLVYNPLSMLDLFSNQAVIHRMHYPADMLYRIIKYIKKGYNASPATLMEVANLIKNSTDDTSVTGKMEFYGQ